MVQKNKVNIGSDVSSGKFKCSGCGKIISAQSITSLPPCKSCADKGKKITWKVLTGVGDNVKDPYPNK